MDYIELFGTRVLVKPDTIPDEVTLGSGVVLQNTRTEEQITTGRVVNFGPDCALPLTLGDRLLFSPWSGFSVKLGGEKYKMLDEEEILAKLGSEGDATVD